MDSHVNYAVSYCVLNVAVGNFNLQVVEIHYAPTTINRSGYKK